MPLRSIKYVATHDDFFDMRRTFELVDKAIYLIG
jgi:hypothetical protein